jgi:hypothetical protein
MQVQVVESMLSNISDSESRVLLNLSLLGQSLTLEEERIARWVRKPIRATMTPLTTATHGQQLDQGRFSCSVGTEDTDTTAQ